MGKLYYSIGEVADMFEVNTSLIRFWEKEFKSIKPKKNKKGNRLFTEKDIEAIKEIYHLVKEKGYTLDGAKSELKSAKNSGDENAQIIRKLQAIKSELNKLKDQL
ncbi:MAG: MerR family transcriptional regulator [Crocinitomicaceae bacterium]|nr:MerR family transcriptional regulator [Crocinitomicaceae bacterium]